MMPMPPPMTMATNVAANPTISEIRAAPDQQRHHVDPAVVEPQRVLRRRRREDGPTCLCTSYGAIQGARSAIRMISKHAGPTCA